eukprot:COSAG02_NODE_5765_length_4055_cov_2.682002_2_plen_233_part_00
MATERNPRARGGAPRVGYAIRLCGEILKSSHFLVNHVFYRAGVDVTHGFISSDYSCLEVVQVRYRKKSLRKGKKVQRVSDYPTLFRTQQPKIAVHRYIRYKFTLKILSDMGAAAMDARCAFTVTRVARGTRTEVRRAALVVGEFTTASSLCCCLGATEAGDERRGSVAHLSYGLRAWPTTCRMATVRMSRPSAGGDADGLVHVRCCRMPYHIELQLMHLEHLLMWMEFHMLL